MHGQLEISFQLSLRACRRTTSRLYIVFVYSSTVLNEGCCCFVFFIRPEWRSRSRMWDNTHVWGLDWFCWLQPILARTRTHTHTPRLTWHALILMILSESVAQVWLGCYRRFSHLSIMLGPSMGCAQGEEPWVHWSLEMKPWTSMRWIKMGGTYRETPNLWNILHIVLAFYKTFNRESPRNTVVLCVCVCFEKGHWSHSSS